MFHLPQVFYLNRAKRLDYRRNRIFLDFPPRLALIWGENEVAAQSAIVKQLRDGKGEQNAIPMAELEKALRSIFGP